MLRQKAGSMLTLFSLACVLTVALVVGAVAPDLGGGAGSAEAASLPYLSEALNQEAKISMAELAAIRVPAYYNCPGNLTTRRVRQSARCFLDLWIERFPEPPDHTKDNRVVVEDVRNKNGTQRMLEVGPFAEPAHEQGPGPQNCAKCRRDHNGW